MTDHALASFEAKDGTGRWEVFTWGIIANGQRYHFTKQSHIVCAGLPGRTEKHVYQTEEDDGFGLWAALAVYQETGSLTDAGLAAWALGGPSIETHIDTREIPGNVTLSIGHLRRGRDANLSLRYREDGRWVQVGAIQHFADITLAAINAYRAGALLERCCPRPSDLYKNAGRRIEEV